MSHEHGAFDQLNNVMSAFASHEFFLLVGNRIVQVPVGVLGGRNTVGDKLFVTALRGLTDRWQAKMALRLPQVKTCKVRVAAEFTDKLELLGYPWPQKLLERLK